MWSRSLAYVIYSANDLFFPTLHPSYFGGFKKYSAPTFPAWIQTHGLWGWTTHPWRPSSKGRGQIRHFGKQGFTFSTGGKSRFERQLYYEWTGGIFSAVVQATKGGETTVLLESSSYRKGRQWFEKFIPGFGFECESCSHKTNFVFLIILGNRNRFEVWLSLAWGISFFGVQSC